MRHVNNNYLIQSAEFCLMLRANCIILSPLVSMAWPWHEKTIFAYIYRLSAIITVSLIFIRPQLCMLAWNKTKKQLNSSPIDELGNWHTFHITLCPHCDITSPPICINQNLEWLSNQECYHNKINAIVHHFESYFEWDNQKFRFVST